MAPVVDLEEQKVPQQDYQKMDNKALMQRARDNTLRFNKNMEKAADQVVDLRNDVKNQNKTITK